jgi:vancomycin resistance protein YoaR
VAIVARRAASYRTGGHPWKPASAALLAIAALCALALGVNAAFADRALPRLTVAGIDVGTMRSGELRDRLEREVAQPWSAARVTVNGPDSRAWTTTNAALAIAPDVERAVADALAYGHTGSVTQRVVAWLSAVRGRATVPFATRADGDAAAAWVRSIASSVDRRASDGAIVTTQLGISVTPAVIGREADRSALQHALLAPTALGDRELTLPVRESYPSVDPSGIRDAATKVTAATTPLHMTAGDGSVSEDSAALATLLVVERALAAPGEVDAIPAGAVAPAARYAYRVRFDESRVAAWIALVAKRLDHPAKNASYAVQSDGSLAVVPGVDGVKLDRPKVLSEILALLFAPSASPREVVPTFVRDTPAFTTEQAQRYAGQMTQVATFTTSYPANAARHANITTGAAQFDNVVLAPGESFSFWDRLGPVTVQRGYAYAGAIIENKSDENVIGGGLCQVSTTLFNAVARAGYEVLERHAHGYYIDRYPLGFDAAVFEPGVDFRWKNDTQYPVLIKSYGYAASVRFDLISVPTGRRVVIGDAVQWNLKSPAADQPADPAYLPGAVVQGRDVARAWSVWEGDRLIHDQTFYSHYVPVWGGPAPR